MESFDSSENEETIHRSRNPSGRLDLEPQILDPGLVACADRAAYNIGVPTDILRRRVHHEIDSVIERPLQSFAGFATLLVGLLVYALSQRYTAKQLSRSATTGD